MRTSNMITFAVLAASLGLTAACNHRGAPLVAEQPTLTTTTAASTEIPAARQPIWVVTETPVPLPMVSLVPGASTRVSLLGSSRLPLFTIQNAGLENDIGVSLVMEEDALVLRAEPGSDGFSMVKATLISPKGEVDDVYFPVQVDPLPIVTFRFNPEGRSVTRVFAAGSFNGWSNSSDELIRQPDGTFLLDKAITPGSHTYKLVVDGDWIADPANPEQDSSGFGNSVLRVAGEAQKTFQFGTLSAMMPGSGRQGGFAAQLPQGSAIDPGSVSLVVNNKRRRTSDWSLDHSTGIIRMNLPAGDWLTENNIILTATTTDNRRGSAVARFSYTAAPRSPRDEVIYFPMTDRFLDGDPTNNPVQDNTNVHPLAQYHGGDWAGIRQKIEDGYFTRLGITTLWISPPNENTFNIEQESVEPGRLYSSYHGYWPTAFDRTNPAFGSMDELRGLVAAAHERGIAILIDFVSNHVHVDHPLFKADPTIGAPLILPDGSRNIRKFDQHPFTTWFDTFIPTLDYERRPDLIETMTDSAIFWLRETGADGFRHDAVKHVPLPFWQELTRKLRREIIAGDNRTVYQVGETISGHSTVSEFVGPDLLDGQFDFPTYFAIQNVLGRGTGRMADLADAIRGAQRHYPPMAIMSPLIGNHDVSRFMAYADGALPPGANEREIAFNNPPVVRNTESYRKLHMGFAYTTALEGPPTIYYGDEIGMTGAQDPDNRRPMIWNDWTPEQQLTQRIVADLNHFRLGSIALRRGETEVLHESDEALVIARIAPEEVIVAAFHRNTGTAPTTVTLPPWWGEPVLSDPFNPAMVASTNGNTITILGESWSFNFWAANW